MSAVAGPISVPSPFLLEKGHEAPSAFVKSRTLHRYRDEGPSIFAKTTPAKSAKKAGVGVMWRVTGRSSLQTETHMSSKVYPPISKTSSANMK